MKLIYILIYILGSGLNLVQGVTLTDWFNWFRERNVHCQDGRTDLQIVQDDEFSQSYFNGSILDSIDKLGAKEISKLMQYNSRSRGGITNCMMRQWGYANQELYRLSNSPLENANVCQEQLNELYNFMKNMTEDSPIYFPCEKPFKLSENHLYLQLSSFGRLPVGRPDQMNIWAGDYDTCLSLPYSRYCFGSFTSNDPEDPSRRKLPLDFNILKIGICLPKSCSAEMAKSHGNLAIIEEMVRFNLMNVFLISDNNQHKLSDLYCLPSKDSPWLKLNRESLSTFLIYFGIIWIGLTILCTLAHPFKQYIGDWIGIFSILENWKLLFVKRRSYKELSIIDIMKVIGMIMILINHMQLSFNPMTRNISSYMHQPFLSILFLGQHNVSMFLMVSCFLAAYMKFQSKSEFKPIDLVVKRYLRMLPMYLTIYAYTKQFAHLWGSGPFWDYGISPQSSMRQCKSESWLVPILMLANFLSPLSHCVLTGWYVAVDFQVYCLVVVILYIYRCSRLYGHIVAMGAFIFSHLFHVWYYQTSDSWSHNQLYNNPIIFGPVIVVIRLLVDYATPLGRIGSGYLGVLLANLTHLSALKWKRIALLDLNDENLETSSKFIRKISLISGFIFLALTYLSPLSPQWLKNCWGDMSKGLNYNFTRLSNELGWFFLIYGAVITRLTQMNNNIPSKKIPTWRGFLNSSFWSVLSKMSYSIMLSHSIVISLMIQTSRDTFNFNYVNFYLHLIPVILCSYLVGAILLICVEYPLNRITKIAFGTL